MFKDRFDAARQLVSHLKQYANNPDAIILAVPRGGVELGYVLAKELHLPLDVIFTKKIGYPGNPEYAIGAVSLQHVFLNEEYANLPHLKEYIIEQVTKIRHLLHDRQQRYRGDKPPLSMTKKIIIVVDDGVATGNTLLATLALIRQEYPQKIVVALPVAPPEAVERLRKEADEVVCLKIPHIFHGVGGFYQNFSQVDDQEAIRLFHEANT